jgi:hypothetical protein
MSETHVHLPASADAAAAEAEAAGTAVETAAEATTEQVERQAEAGEHQAEVAADAAVRQAELAAEVEHHRIDAAAGAVVATAEGDEWRSAANIRMAALEDTNRTILERLEALTLTLTTTAEEAGAAAEEAIDPERAAHEAEATRQPAAPEGAQGPRSNRPFRWIG